MGGGGGIGELRGDGAQIGGKMGLIGGWSVVTPAEIADVGDKGVEVWKYLSWNYQPGLLICNCLPVEWQIIKWS